LLGKIRKEEEDQALLSHPPHSYFIHLQGNSI